MKDSLFFVIAFLIIVFTSCKDQKREFVNDTVGFAEVQFNNALKAIPGEKKLPRSVIKDGSLVSYS